MTSGRSISRVLREHGIETDDIEHVEGGKTFFWRGHYEHDMNVAHTDDTQLNVFADFHPKLSEASRSSADALPRQHPAGAPARRPRPVTGVVRRPRLDEPLDRDCARLAHRRDRRGRLRAAQRCRAADADREAEPETGGEGDDGARAEVVVAKRGEYGAICSRPTRSLRSRPSRLEEVRDPTGAGDSFAGGFLGYLDSVRADGVHDEQALRRAMVYGSVMASFNVEDFGTERVARLDARTRSPGASRSSSG